MPCPEPEALSAFSRGGLPPDRRMVVEAHLDGCATCSRVVSELARIYATDGDANPVDREDPAPSDSDTLADDSLPRGGHPRMQPGERLDRYHILEVVGRGGMGVVYAAYDPDLDRKVALKALHQRDGVASLRAQKRLLREAQAMAKLSHPNVITVHEVRLIGAQVYLSMEFVERGTLTQWLRRTKPDRAQVLAMFQDVGRGLAAAHEAGLIHRDVKPDNVLIGHDDRPRVTDFGLARPALEGEHSAKRSHPATGPVSVAPARLDPTQSRTQGLVGTPAYMSPEQLVGEPVTVASDQFSFCVALYEALWGVRPFNGSTLAELANHVLDGKFTEPDHDPGVPRWLRQVIVRGLSRRPEDRWPSMSALVERLEPEPPRARRRLVAVGGVGLGLVAAGLLASRVLSAPQDPCDAGERAMQEQWGSGARSEVQHALSQGATPYAEDTATLAVQRLDEYAAQWSASHRAACEGYHRGEQSDEALDLRGACLDERRRELEALLELLVEGEPEIRRHAVEAVDGLQPLAPCNDVEALRARVPPPDDPAVRPRVQQVEGKLARVRAHVHAGRYEAGLILANETTDAARATAYTPLLARVLRERATLHEHLGEHEEAVVDLREAWPKALGAGDDAVAAQCVVDLVGVLGHSLMRYDQAALRIDDATAMIERVRRFDPGRAKELEASLLSARGRIEMRLHHYDEAKRLYEQALTLAEQRHGSDSLGVASVLNALASARLATQDWEQARETYQRVLTIRTRHLGSAHPETGHARNNVGLALKNLRRYDDAARQLQLSLEILGASLGADHPSLAMVKLNLAEAYFPVQRYAEAAALYRAVFEPLPTEADHEHVVRKLQHYGASLHRSGQPERGREVLLAAHELAVGLSAPRVLRSINADLARIAMDEGDAVHALERLELVPHDDADSPPFTADLGLTRARALLALGQVEAARALLPEIREGFATPSPGWPTVDELDRLIARLDDASPDDASP